jgi:hypothetical protein
MNSNSIKKPDNWVSIFGNAEVNEGVVTLRSGITPDTMPDSPPQPPHALLKCDVEFEQGIIECEIFPTEPESRCQLVLAAGSGDLFAGLNVLGAPYGFAVFQKNQWEPLGGTGHGSMIEPNKWQKLKLIVNGSNLILYVNGVEVARSSYRLTRGQLGIFLQGIGPTAMRNLSTHGTEPTCFVIMQFSSEFNELFSEVIRPTCEEFGYKVIRADDNYGTGLIIDDITRSIREASIVIADVTPNNPNVFYEVGFAHGIGKPTILLSDRKRENLPFDISGFRALFYDNTIGGKSTVQERLRRHLESIAVPLIHS